MEQTEVIDVDASIEDNTEKPKEEKKEKYWLFKKGQSGNPKGRPKKGNCFTDILERELKNTSAEIFDKKTGQKRIANGKEMLVLSLIRLALHSDDESIKLKAIDKIIERIDGKPIQPMQVDAEVNNSSALGEIDVSKLNTKQKEELENILQTMYADETAIEVDNPEVEDDTD